MCCIGSEEPDTKRSSLPSCSRMLMALMICLRCSKYQNTTLLTSDTTNRKIALTDSQCHLIRRSWKICHAKKLTHTAFLKILLTNCKVREIFQLHLVSDELLMTNPRFTNHAESLGIFMDVCVTNLQVNPKRIALIAHSIGEKHVDFRWVNFDAEYWLLFKSAIIECIVDELNITDSTHVVEAWNKFLLFVLSEIKSAFLDAVKNQHSKPATQAPKEVLKQNLVNELEAIKS